MEDLSWSVDMGQLKFIVATFIQEMDIKSPFKKNKTEIYNNSTCQRFWWGGAEWIFYNAWKSSGYFRCQKHQKDFLI